MKMKKTLYFILALFGVALFIFMIISSGLFENLDIFLKMNILLFILAFIVSNFNILLKIYRWQYLSRSYGIALSFHDAGIVVLGGGFIGGISPGKIGDVIKADIMKAQYSLPLTKGITMLFYERVFELAIIFLVAMGIIFVDISGEYFLILQVTFILLIFFGIVYIFFERFKATGQRFLGKIGMTRLAGMDISIERLPRLEVLIVFGLTFLAMILEFVRIWIVCLAFNYHVDIIQLSVFFSISVLIGLLSQVPIGIGVVEGSLTYFLGRLGIPSYSAFGIAIMDRLISMYYVIIVGLFYYSKVMKYNLDGTKGLDNNPDIQ